MCGRARLSSDVSEIKIVFSIPPERPTPNIPANWNAAPTEDLPVIRYDTRAGERSLDVLRWGLVPFWAKDIKVGFCQHQRQGRGDRDQAGLPRGLSAATLPRSLRLLLRVAKDRQGQTTLRRRPSRPAADGARRLMGNLAVARG